LFGSREERVDLQVLDGTELLGFGEARGFEGLLEEALLNDWDEMQGRSAIVVPDAAALLKMEGFSH
jgi:hypothetical protein